MTFDKNVRRSRAILYVAYALSTTPLSEKYYEVFVIKWFPLLHSLFFAEPPSPPICRIQGTAEYWQDIRLTCVSEEGSPKPTYKWNSYSVQNQQRPLPPKASDGMRFNHIYASLKHKFLVEWIFLLPVYEKNVKMFCFITVDGVLSLFNISRETSGFYICTSTNRIDSASCNLTLAVLPGSCL